MKAVRCSGHDAMVASGRGWDAFKAGKTVNGACYRMAFRREAYAEGWRAAQAGLPRPGPK